MTDEYSKTYEARESTGSGRKLDLPGALRRHWKKGVLVFLAVLALGLPAAWQKGKAAYRAEGVIYVSPRNWRNLDNDPEQELQSNSQFREFMQQQAHTINRYDIVLPVVTGGAPGAVYFRGKLENDRRAADRLRGALQIAAVPDTYQMTVALEGDKPDGLSEVVNAVMENYIQVARREMFFDSESRLKNLAEERDRMQADMTKTMEQRGAIAQRIGTTLFSGAVINNYEKLAGANQDALMDARRQHLAAEAAIGVGQNRETVKASVDALATEETLRDNALTSYRATLSARRGELLMKIQGLAPKHAGRIAAEKDIAAIDSEIHRATQEAQLMAANRMQSIKAGKLAQASDLENKFQRQEAEIKTKASDYMRNYQAAVDLGGELERIRKRLNATEDRINQLQLETKAPGYVRIFSPAMRPDIPIRGGRKRLFGMVTLAALALALLVPVSFDYLDPRVRSPRELQAVLGLPVTGWMPRVTNETGDAGQVLRLAVVVRRHLEKLNGLLAITSLRHGTGSSSISLALGKALETIGVKTLVIEANPKTPDLRYAMGKSRPGVAQWIAGASFHDCVHPATPQLPERIATGEGATELELMSGDGMQRLLAHARQHYDLVLVDASPIACSLLGEELVRRTSAVLLISQAERDSRAELKACVEMIEKLQPRIFGSVLNCVRTGKEDANDNAAVRAA